MQELIAHQETINRQLARYGVKFGIYKNGEFKERLFPFDPLPRVIPAAEFAVLDKGLCQRVMALNMFLKDLYGDKKIIRDGVVPEDFAFAGSGYLPACEGFTPPKGIYSHISGIALVEGRDGSWFVLEDNLRIPSGASYPLIARRLCRRCSPESFRQHNIVDNRNYGALLRGVMDNVNTGGINVIFTPGRYNAAYFEHSYLADSPSVNENDRKEFIQLADIVDGKPTDTMLKTSILLLMRMMQAHFQKHVILVLV